MDEVKQFRKSYKNLIRKGNNKYKNEQTVLALVHILVTLL